jgi:hypothetical protein
VSRVRFLTRDGCQLCEEMLAELAPWAAARGVAFTIEDVDGDPQLRRRYGLKVPVLLFDDEPIAHARLGSDALDGLARAIARSRSEATRLV